MSTYSKLPGVFAGVAEHTSRQPSSGSGQIFCMFLFHRQWWIVTLLYRQKKVSCLWNALLRCDSLSLLCTQPRHHHGRRMSLVNTHCHRFCNYKLVLQASLDMLRPFDTCLHSTHFRLGPPLPSWTDFISYEFSNIKIRGLGKQNKVAVNGC